MDFFILLAKAIAATVTVALAILITGSLLLRKSTPNRRQTLGPAALSLAFASGFLLFWGWPGLWPAEAWQTTLLTALAAGLLLTPPDALKPGWRWLLTGLAIAAVTLLTVREKLTPRELFLTALPAAMLLYTAALRPSLRNPKLWLTPTATLFLSTHAAVLVVMLYIDQNTGRMFVLLAALSGTLIGASAIRPLRDAARGGATILATLFAAVLALAAFYNYALPNSVFILLALAPLGSAVAWIPALKIRPWTCAALAIITTLAFTAPALYIAVKNAPAFE